MTQEERRQITREYLTDNTRLYGLLYDAARRIARTASQAAKFADMRHQEATGQPLFNSAEERRAALAVILGELDEIAKNTFDNER